MRESRNRNELRISWELKQNLLVVSKLASYLGPFIDNFLIVVMSSKLKIAVIGGGAAGFFAAISCKHHHPSTEVHLFEKTKKTLGKVKISGGGRCNVTHNCRYSSDLIKNYPRGGKKLKKIFSAFGTLDTVEWFLQKGVTVKVEDDGRMFPNTDNSQSIIDALWKGINEENINVLFSSSVSHIKIIPNGFELLVNKEILYYDKVIVATGGFPKSSSYDWLRSLGITIIPPVPSLFTFNIPKTKITKLMGVVAHASIRIKGLKYMEQGPLLITHWGMSGPAVLKLSSWAARDLYDLNYNFEILINWVPSITQEKIKPALSIESKKKIKNNNPFNLPARLWAYLILKAGIDENQSWNETIKKNKNKLVNVICQDDYVVSGKTTFKEEFVTCGGVSLDQINNLYFAGEVLNVDAITGGYNFQAAWSTGFVAGKLH
jgi:predicted Rossmann fold flavoprotein